MQKQHKKFIKLKPDVWTKHHTHRVLHVSGLIIILVVLVSSSWVFGNKLAQIQADNATLSTGVGVTIAAISDGPTAIIGGGSGGGNGGGSPAPGPAPASAPAPNNNLNIPNINTPTPPAEIPPQHKLVNQPAVEIVPPVSTPDVTVTERQIQVNGTTQTQYVFNSQHPQFSGRTNIKNAFVHLEIASAYHVTGNVYADEYGDWSWDPKVPVSPGNHTLTIIATDQLEPQITTKSVIYFAVNLAPGQVVELPSIGNTVAVGNGGNLFDVIVGIPQQFKISFPGDELVAKVKFVNYGTPGHPVDVEVRYVIHSADGNVIMQSSQTVAVATQLAILKTFYTTPAMLPGIYTLTVSVPSEDLVATATDTFELKIKPVAAAPTLPINYTTTFQGLAGLILLFSLVLYLEYNKVEVLSSTIKQITEKDLAGEA